MGHHPRVNQPQQQQPAQQAGQRYKEGRIIFKEVRGQDDQQVDRGRPRHYQQLVAGQFTDVLKKEADRHGDRQINQQGPAV